MYREKEKLSTTSHSPLSRNAAEPFRLSLYQYPENVFRGRLSRVPGRRSTRGRTKLSRCLLLPLLLLLVPLLLLSLYAGIEERPLPGVLREGMARGRRAEELTRQRRQLGSGKVPYATACRRHHGRRRRTRTRRRRTRRTRRRPATSARPRRRPPRCRPGTRSAPCTA